MRKPRIRSDPSTLIGNSSEAGFWCVDRSRLVKLGYEDENSTISLAIISKMNSVKKFKKTIYFLREIRYNIYRK